MRLSFFSPVCFCSLICLEPGLIAVSGSACIFIASTVLAAAYKASLWLRSRARAPGQRCWMQSWDTAPLVPSMPTQSPGTVVVGVWMSDDINPKYIHRVSTVDLNEKALQQLADNDGYVYRTAGGAAADLFLHVIVMRSLAIPTHVAVLFKRLVNAVSTLSISHHCLETDSYRSLQETGAVSEKPYPTHCQSRWQEALSVFQEKWNNAKDGWDAGTYVQASSVSIPWWPSLFSSSPGQRQSSSAPEPKRSHPHRQQNSAPNPSKEGRDEEPELPKDIIHKLLVNPALSDPLRTPRYPIVLCHGLYGFDARGPSAFPSMRMNYWANVLHILRGKLGAEVIVTSVPGTGNISSRSARLDEQLKSKARGRGVNFLAHSMGGLDCRHLITHVKPSDYTPLSLTSVATPHRGSPFMDWCVENIGIGKLLDHEKQLLHARAGTNGDDEFRPPPVMDPEPKLREQQSAESSTSSFNFALLPSSFTTLLLSVVDSPAYANLTSAYLNDIFNPATPDDPNVKYFSVAGRVPTVGVLHPFWFPKMIVDNAEADHRLEAMQKHLAKYGFHEEPDLTHLPMWANEHEWGNDGLVTVQSAKWGEFLGVMDGCDHWEMRGARGIEFGVDLPAIPAIGLGVGLASSAKDRATAQAEKSYVAEWTRFLTGWKRDAKPAGKPSESPSRAQPQTSEARKAAQEQREADYKTGDQVVRSSTDRLSVVVDWLVEQIPSPQALPVVSKLVSASDRTEETESNDREVPKPDDSAQQMKRLAAEMVACTAGPSGTSSSSSAEASSTPQGRSTEKLRREVKKMMEGEQKRWKKNELETKADLERFYVALSRRMWDEGL
ncbi:lipase 2 [Coprinopsis sp. MPI-PUGE-AT-0042]|nr:lipase 2 [Coprinopsis sp. MPI-PUGE-AT-0042]